MQHVGERLGEHFGAGRSADAMAAIPGLAGGKDQAGIGGRGVAVDGDGIEARIDRRLRAGPAGQSPRSVHR